MEGNGVKGLLGAEGRAQARVWILLAIAIAVEVSAATCMKLTAGFTDPGYSVATVVLFATSFTLLSQVLTILPIGFVYGVWGGIGTIATALVGTALWGDPLNAVMGVGMAVIIAGIALLAQGFNACSEEDGDAF